MRGADEPRRLADCGMPLYFNVLPARERTVVVAMVTARRHTSGDDGTALYLHAFILLSESCVRDLGWIRCSDDGDDHCAERP